MGRLATVLSGCCASTFLLKFILKVFHLTDKLVNYKLGVAVVSMRAGYVRRGCPWLPSPKLSPDPISLSACLP